MRTEEERNAARKEREAKIAERFAHLSDEDLIQMAADILRSVLEGTWKERTRERQVLPMMEYTYIYTEIWRRSRE